MLAIIIMGNCLKSTVGDAIRPFISPPVILKTFSAADINQVIKEQTKCDTIIMYDNEYDAIEVNDVKRFLKSNINNDYRVEANDCDDAGIIVTGRIRGWAYNRKNRNGGLCFGLLSGNLKIKDSDPDRPHAVGFFIDSDKKIHICDGLWNEIYDITPSMEIWNVIV